MTDTGILGPLMFLVFGVASFAIGRWLMKRRRRKASERERRVAEAAQSRQVRRAQQRQRRR